MKRWLLALWWIGIWAFITSSAEARGYYLFIIPVFIFGLVILAFYWNDL